MNDYVAIKSSHIVIIGLGLMGGSLALALRGKCQKIEAVDPDENVVTYAQQNGIVDFASTKFYEEISLNDIIILAASVKTILTLLDHLTEYHHGTPVVLDLGSTKAEIVSKMNELPERFDPIGGHPMCGKEKSSIFHADANLFQGAIFALTPLQRTSDRACSLAEQLVMAVGANPLWIEADTHDRWVAATSHVPYLISNALVYVTPTDATPLIGPGFRSSTRLAGSSIQMMGDILETNRLNVLTSLRRFQEHLKVLEDLLDSTNYDLLTQTLESGAQRYYSSMIIDQDAENKDLNLEHRINE